MHIIQQSIVVLLPSLSLSKVAHFCFIFGHTGQTCTLYSPHTPCVPQKFHPICDVIFHDKMKHGVAYFAPAFKTMFRSFVFHL